MIFGGSAGSCVGLFSLKACDCVKFHPHKPCIKLHVHCLSTARRLRDFRFRVRLPVNFGCMRERLQWRRRPSAKQYLYTKEWGITAPINKFIQSILSDCTPVRLHALLTCTHFPPTNLVPTLNCTILSPCTLHGIFGAVQSNRTYYS